jgi:transcriptional regulator with XRE-family HTH domain
MNPIKRRREAKGWTVSHLAQCTGVSTQAVYKWETGSLPQPPRLRMVAEMFAVDYLDLVSEILNWSVGVNRVRSRGVSPLVKG